MRGLIVNADDFGLTAGVTRGIVRAHDDGVVTSASLMVLGPAARESSALAAARPALSVGLHAELGEWTYQEGEWVETRPSVDLDDAAAVATELDRQLELFHELTGSEPTHLDSHQHVHREEAAQSVFRSRAARLGVPLRGDSEAVRHYGSFYGQTGCGEPIDGALSVESLIGILVSLPEGVTELGCHPGEPDGLTSTYAAERLVELEILCDPRIREAIAAADIQLFSFRDIAL